MSTIGTSDTRVKGVRTGTGIGPGRPDGRDLPKPGPGGGDKGNDDVWPPGFTRDDAIEPNKFHIGMWVGLASILMLFVSLTSAYILRQSKGLSDAHDWFPLRMPSVLWATTAVLLMSSVTIELARRALRHSQYGWFRLLISLTTLLGLLFLAGQLRAWAVMVDQGVYVYSHPHSSFFYVLTGLHAIHLMGGLIALALVTISAFRMRITRSKRNAVDVTALYWHFMDGLWIYLFVLLFFFR